jgi:hypothetical protein
MAEKFEIRRFILRDASNLLSFLIALGMAYSGLHKFWVAQNTNEVSSMAINEIRKEIEQLKTRLDRNDVELAVIRERLRR